MTYNMCADEDCTVYKKRSIVVLSILCVPRLSREIVLSGLFLFCQYFGPKSKFECLEGIFNLKQNYIYKFIDFN